MRGTFIALFSFWSLRFLSECCCTCRIPLSGNIYYSVACSGPSCYPLPSSCSRQLGVQVGNTHGRGNLWKGEEGGSFLCYGNSDILFTCGNTAQNVLYCLLRICFKPLGCGLLLKGLLKVTRGDNSVFRLEFY